MLKPAFSAIDSDKDGSIDLEEFSLVMTLIMYPQSPGINDTIAQIKIKNMFDGVRTADGDRNESIDFKGFRSLICFFQNWQAFLDYDDSLKEEEEMTEEDIELFFNTFGIGKNWDYG